MDIKERRRLFWFLRGDAELNLNDPSVLDMYVQQVLTHGLGSDIKEMFQQVGKNKFLESFHRIKGFIPKDIRNFWESEIGSLDTITKGNSHHI